MAGETCEEKHLLVLDNDSFKSELNIGMDISDQSFRKRVEHKFVKENLIALSINNQKFEDDELINNSTYFEYFLFENSGLVKRTNEPD